MDSHKICLLTQSPEKFLCLNQECCHSEKKQLQCYECLNKQHIGKNKTIRHLDDFIELDKFMKLIKDKCQRKEAFLNQLILSCNDYLKEKIQLIELTQTSDVANLVRSKLECDFSEFLLKLGQEQMKLKSFQIYSMINHSQFIQFYFENDSQYFDNFKKQFQQLIESTQTFVLAFDCNIKNQFKKLEDIIKNLSQTQSKNGTYKSQNHIILWFLIPFILSYFLLQYQLEAKIYNFSQESKQNQEYKHALQEENIKIQILEQHIILLNNTVDILKSQTQELAFAFNITNENLEKIKLRFDSFKRSQQNLSQELKNQIFDLNEKLKSEQDIPIQSNFQEQINSLQIKFINLTETQDKQLINFKDQIINFQQNLSARIINLEQGFLTPQNKTQQIIAENQDLIGQIHLNLSLSRLSNFTLIYDHYFNKYISLSKIDKLHKMATENNGNSLICLGGLSIENLSEFIVAACDFASEVFQPTESHLQARKSQNGDIYWYLVDYRSFGFSPKESILLIICDDEEPDDEKRFSYWFSPQGRVGGRRIGKETHLDNSLQHKLQIYMLKL